VHFEQAQRWMLQKLSSDIFGCRCCTFFCGGGSSKTNIILRPWCIIFACRITFDASSMHVKRGRVRMSIGYRPILMQHKGSRSVSGHHPCSRRILSASATLLLTPLFFSFLFGLFSSLCSRVLTLSDKCYITKRSHGQLGFG
jgi:hypothetical protein